MIFAIKRFETHDGDGIRTTVFFKGCSLRCVWCHNPESFKASREISYNSELCKSCGRCGELCEANTFEEGKHTFFREKCNFCGECQNVCPERAFEIYGDARTPSEIAEEVLLDKMFFKGSGGGVTFSGGEPLLQAEYCAELASILKKSGINIAVDTCGYVSREAIDKILPYTDTFLYDVKAIDSKVHKKCTGKTNERILENLKYIDGCGKNIEIRIPYIPGYNSGEMEKIAEFLSKLKNVTGIRVLPYHKYAEAKYVSLGIENISPEDLPTKAEIEHAKEKIGKICIGKVL